MCSAVTKLDLGTAKQHSMYTANSLTQHLVTSYLELDRFPRQIRGVGKLELGTPHVISYSHFVFPYKILFTNSIEVLIAF